MTPRYNKLVRDKAVWRALRWWWSWSGDHLCSWHACTARSSCVHTKIGWLRKCSSLDPSFRLIFWGAVEYYVWQHLFEWAETMSQSVTQIVCHHSAFHPFICAYIIIKSDWIETLIASAICYLLRYNYLPLAWPPTSWPCSFSELARRVPSWWPLP